MFPPRENLGGGLFEHPASKKREEQKRGAFLSREKRTRLFSNQIESEKENRLFNHCSGVRREGKARALEGSPKATLEPSLQPYSQANPNEKGKGRSEYTR